MITLCRAAAGPELVFFDIIASPKLFLSPQKAWSFVSSYNINLILLIVSSQTLVWKLVKDKPKDTQSDKWRLSNRCLAVQLVTQWDLRLALIHSFNWRKLWVIWAWRRQLFCKSFTFQLSYIYRRLRHRKRELQSHMTRTVIRCLIFLFNFSFFFSSPPKRRNAVVRLHTNGSLTRLIMEIWILLCARQKNSRFIQCKIKEILIFFNHCLRGKVQGKCYTKASDVLVLAFLIASSFDNVYE